MWTDSSADDIICKKCGRASGPGVVRRARGCMMGLMIGDALGAAVEGMSPICIQQMARQLFQSDLIEDYILAVPMGTYVPADEPGTYREGRGANDNKFVNTGPTTNPDLLKQCARKGMYTDDTNACLAVGMSIAECCSVDAVHVAHSVARLFLKDNEAYRGCPPTAKQNLWSILDGMSPEVTGLPPHFPFPGGSFANGGGMRISPVGIAYRNADRKTLRQAVIAATLFSHRHPEAIDFAVVQAAAVRYALCIQPNQFDTSSFLADMVAMCDTDVMKNVIEETTNALARHCEGDDEYEPIKQVVSLYHRPGSGMSFQIASVHMAPCVLWVVCLHHSSPRKAVQAAIALVVIPTACMVGAIMGALHGEDWCRAPPDLTADLENGPHGRDFGMALAERLACLDA
eukprot:CAMPEP_0169318090 /NCGR_PEP_ID=MMETSP1017-20121227/7095_1 /TAXON_ID=342587 /ORGANISM="Karlodinium micrum, Strain CCMP2283" /LENGTH=400 /DNA_ID=CAMNT_0009412331 /DNA_START=78 /DNA_END=1281 /DNA_ORIENTATION=-